jgi:sterol desaturase/sphingolipid hydroxylase (fatty acid hydroxylase superfamily)
MSNWLLTNEVQLQSYLLAGGLLIVAAWETFLPRRAFTVSAGKRWFQQIALVTLGSLLIRACLPFTAISVAILAGERGWGLLNVVDVPSWLSLLVGIVALDAANYAQHRLSHEIPLLWRFHQVHHSDLDVDCGTALRHHPGEAVVSQAFVLAVIATVGVSPVATVLGLTLGIVASLFNHGNVALPRGVDAALRLVVVTPDMHRIHHSVNVSESNRNFANLLPWWDRLFATYQRDPAVDQRQMVTGLATARTPRDVTLSRLLALPFRPLPTDTHPEPRLRNGDATAGPRVAHQEK